MISKRTIIYAHLSNECVQKANKLNLSDRTIISHFKSTKTEKWKLSTEDWINKLYDKKFNH